MHCIQLTMVVLTACSKAAAAAPYKYLYIDVGLTDIMCCVTKHPCGWLNTAWFILDQEGVTHHSALLVQFCVLNAQMLHVIGCVGK